MIIKIIVTPLRAAGRDKCVGREAGVIYEVRESEPRGLLSDALISLFAAERVMPR